MKLKTAEVRPSGGYHLTLSFIENRRHMPDEYDLNMKTLTDKLTKHTQVQESLIISSAKDDHKLIDDFFEEKLETDNSTPTNEKVLIEFYICI